MTADQVVDVVFLDLANDLRHPLKLLLCARHPDEVHLHNTTHNYSALCNHVFSKTVVAVSAMHFGKFLYHHYQLYLITVNLVPVL